MLDYKIIGVKDFRINKEYCEVKVKAESKKQAEELYLILTQYEYDVLRVEEIALETVR